MKWHTLWICVGIFVVISVLRIIRSRCANNYNRRGKGAFILDIPLNGRVLDVGCGNNSPEWSKKLRPDIYYIGLDISNYNQQNDPNQFADEYITTSAEQFVYVIEQYSGQMDAVISSHNIEHCEDQQRVLTAMIKSLKPKGKLYLSFPCEESINFPKRGGCLNFFDDTSHKNMPIWNSILKQIELLKGEFEFIAKRYRPMPLALKGLAREPVSMLRREVFRDGSTWALYGFESVMWVVAPDKIEGSVE